MNRVSALVRDAQRAPSPLSLRERTVRSQPSAPRKRALTRTPPGQHLVLGLLVSRRNEFLLITSYQCLDFCCSSLSRLRHIIVFFKVMDPLF